jgi:hypothetical protein
MARIAYRIGADVIWLCHFAVVCIALFGWLIPQLWFLYVAVLAGTLISTLTLGYCILSKWEFDLRKKVNPSMAYDFSYASFYTYRLTLGHLSNVFLARAGVLFAAASLIITLYFRCVS